MIYTVTLNPAVDREFTVQAIAFDSVLRAAPARVDYGGKGFNVSRMLKSLGTPSVALGFAGGRSGEFLRDGLEALGIDTDFVWVEGESRTNVSIVSLKPPQYVKVNEPGPTIAAVDQKRLLEKIRALAAPDDWWVLAGSLPPGMPDSFYADLVRIIQEADGYAILDTSGSALAAGCEAGPYLVKPNASEAQSLTGLRSQEIDAITGSALAIQAKGIPYVVISLGKSGALMTDGQTVWAASSPPIKELNPIGAGDAMVGGLVWGLSQGYPAQEVLKWGVASGAGTASLAGTAVASRQEVEILYKVIKVQHSFAVGSPTQSDSGR